MAAVLTPLGIVVFLGLYLAPIGITRAQEPVPVPGRGDMSNVQHGYCRKSKVECGHRNGRGYFDVSHSALVTVIIATPGHQMPGRIGEYQLRGTNTRWR